MDSGTFREGGGGDKESQMVYGIYSSADVGGKEKGWLKPGRLLVLGGIRKT